MNTGGDSAAENTDFIKWGQRIDLSNTANMKNSVLTECGSSKKMVNWFSLDGESWFAITDHHPSLSVDSEEAAHIALCGFAVSTFSAFTGEHRKNVIAGD